MVAKSIQLNIWLFLFYYASRLNFLKASMCAMRKSTTDAIQYFQSVNLIYLISHLRNYTQIRMPSPRYPVK